MTLTPEEKANELIDKFYDKIEDVECVDGGGWSSNARLIDKTVKIAAIQCALIAVELMLTNNFSFSSIEYGADSTEYWEQVKTKLQNR